MNSDVSVGEPWMWAAFVGFVLLMLALDLFVFGGRKVHRVSVKEAAAWSLAWLSLALLFCAGLWWHLDATLGREIADTKALEFLTGYLIEKSLSVDNVFVFLLIFSAFKVVPEFQRRVLLYGVLGAIVMRAVMILGGAWLVREFDWVLYVFGVFLVVTQRGWIPGRTERFVSQFSSGHAAELERYLDQLAAYFEEPARIR